MDFEDNRSIVSDIFAVHVEVDGGNWDSLSGVHLIFNNGAVECSTSTKSMSSGWNTLEKLDLGNCEWFQFTNSSLKVKVVSDQNSHLRDEVKITTIQVGVDGNHLPTLELEKNITVSGSEKSDYHTLTKMKGLKAIKTHTSDIWLAGTDHDVAFRIGYNGELKTQWAYLDNVGNDRERDQTDIYKGEQLGAINQDIRDYLEYFPDNGKLEVEISLSARLNFNNLF